MTNVSDFCCSFNDCLKILNQKFKESSCDGCNPVESRKYLDKINRYIELEKMHQLALNCGDTDYATEIEYQINSLCNGMSTSEIIYGCTDSQGTNYDSDATEPCVVNGVVNGCCEDADATYTSGCTDPLATNYTINALIDDGSCTYTQYGCTDPNYNNYNPNATVDDGTCSYDCLNGCSCDTLALEWIDVNSPYQLPAPARYIYISSKYPCFS